MKRLIICIVSFVLCFLLITTSVYATTPKALAVVPTIQFQNQSAICSVQVLGNTNDNIQATIKLWYETQCIKTWTESAVTNLNFRDYATATNSGEYTLTVDLTVNGITRPQVSTSKTKS